jgi:hypothetical protein
MLLAIKSMGGESTEAWRAVLDDLIRRGLRRPEFLLVDGAPGLDKAIAAVWNGVPVQRCTVHKHRNLLAHAPERLHEEITADYTDMIYAATREEIEERRNAFIRKWRLKHRAVPTAWRKPASVSSPSPACRRVTEKARARRTPPTGCTRSSNDASRPSCPQPKLPPCCSGPCSRHVRSACVKSMAGRPCQRNSSISRLTSQLESILSNARRFRRANSNHISDGISLALKCRVFTNSLARLMASLSVEVGIAAVLNFDSSGKSNWRRDDPVTCNSLAKLDTLSRGHSQQVCGTPNDMVLKFICAPINVIDLPHHFNDLAAAFLVEDIVELTSEQVEINRASVGCNSVVNQPNGGEIVETEAKFQNSVKLSPPGL